jgi:DNA (cytosine-5)-methyltransferase 1
MQKPSIFDCFCGLGGLSLGADLAGFRVIGGVDADATAITVYQHSFPNALSLHHNLLQTKPSKVLRSAGISRGDVDVLLGGPPCQPYSINNHQRGTHDARCALIETYLGFVSNLRPNWLVMENVPGFASIESGSFLQSLLRSLRARGYHSAFEIVSATEFGVPQRRRRLIVVAGRNVKKLRIAMQELRQRRSNSVTVGNALGDLPERAALESSYRSKPSSAFQKAMRIRASNTIQNHVASGLGPTNLARIKHVPPGGNWRNIPRRLLPPGMRRARLSDHTTRYGRLRSDQPAFTLLTKCDPHWGCFLHPTQDRVLTVREAARLQSIPDHIQFSDNLNTNYRLIGNAVPPLLAKGILEIIR